MKQPKSLESDRSGEALESLGLFSLIVDDEVCPNRETLDYGTIPWDWEYTGTLDWPCACAIAVQCLAEVKLASQLIH